MPYSSSKTSILFLRKKDDNQELQSHNGKRGTDGRKQNGDPLYTGQLAKDGSRELLSELPDVVNAWQTYGIRGNQAIHSYHRKYLPVLLKGLLMALGHDSMFNFITLLVQQTR